MEIRPANPLLNRGLWSLSGCKPHDLARMSLVAGNLFKQSGHFNKDWATRFCVLKPVTLLLYFESDAEVDPKGVIMLDEHSSMQMVTDSSDSNDGYQGKKNVIVVRTGSEGAGKQSIFAAESLSEAKEWIDAYSRSRHDYIISERDDMRKKLEVKIHESEALNGTTTNLKAHVRELDDRILRLQRRNRRSRGATARAVERLLPIATGLLDVSCETRRLIESHTTTPIVPPILPELEVNARRAIDAAEASAEFALEAFSGDQEESLEGGGADEYYDSDLEYDESLEKTHDDDNNDNNEEEEEENGRRRSQMHVRKLKPQVHSENAESTMPVFKALKDSIDAVAVNNASLLAANAALQAQFAALQAKHAALGAKAREVAKVAQVYSKKLQESQRELKEKEAAWESKEIEWADAVHKLSTKLKNEKTRTKTLAEMLRAQPQAVRTTRADTSTSQGGLTNEGVSGGGGVDSVGSETSTSVVIPTVHESNHDSVYNASVNKTTTSIHAPLSMSMSEVQEVPHLHRTASAPSRIDQPASLTPPITPSTSTLGRDLNRAIAELEFSGSGVDVLEDDVFLGGGNSGTNGGIAGGGAGGGVLYQQGAHTVGSQLTQPQPQMQQMQHQQQYQQQQQQQVPQPGGLRQTLASGLRTAFSTGAGSAPDPRLIAQTNNPSGINNNLNTIMANSQPGRIYVFAMAARNLPVSTKHNPSGGIFSSGVEKINALAHSSPSAFLRLNGLEGQERVTRPVDIADRGKELGGCAMFHTLLPLRVAGSLHKSSLRFEVVSQRIMRGETILGTASLDLSMLVDWPGQPHAVWVSLRPSDDHSHHQSEVPIPVEASIVFSPEAAMAHLNASKEGLSNGAASSLPALFHPAPPTSTSDSDHWASKVLPPAPIDGHPALLLQLCYVRAPPTSDRPQFFTNPGEPPPDVPGTYATTTSSINSASTAATIELEGGAGTHQAAIAIPAEDSAAHHNPFAAFGAPTPSVATTSAPVAAAKTQPASTTSTTATAAQSFASSLSSAVASALAPPLQTSQLVANSNAGNALPRAVPAVAMTAPLPLPPPPPEADVFNPFAPPSVSAVSSSSSAAVVVATAPPLSREPSKLRNENVNQTTSISNPSSSTDRSVRIEPNVTGNTEDSVTINSSDKIVNAETPLEIAATDSNAVTPSNENLFASATATTESAKNLETSSLSRVVEGQDFGANQSISGASASEVPPGPGSGAAAVAASAAPYPQVAKLTAQINVLKTAVKTLRAERTQVDSIIEELRSEKKALISELDTLKEGKATLDVAYSGLLAKKMKWAEEKDNAMDEKAALEAKMEGLLKDLEAAKSLVEHDRKAAALERDSATGKLMRAEAAIVERDSKLKKAEAVLLEKDKEKDALTAKLSEMQVWNKNAMTEGKNLLGQVNKLTGEMKLVMIERDSLNSKINSLERQLSETAAEAAAKEKARVVLEAEMASIERSKSASIARCERLEIALTDAQNKLDAFAKAASLETKTSAKSADMDGVIAAMDSLSSSAPSSPAGSQLRQTSGTSIAAVAPATPSDLVARNEMTATQMAALKMINEELRHELEKLQISAAAANEREIVFKSDALTYNSKINSLTAELADAKRQLLEAAESSRSTKDREVFFTDKFRMQESRIESLEAEVASLSASLVAQPPLPPPPPPTPHVDESIAASASVAVAISDDEASKTKNTLDDFKSRLAESEATIALLTASVEEEKAALRKLKTEEETASKNKIEAFEEQIKDIRTQLSSALNDKEVVQTALANEKKELQDALISLKEKSEFAESLSLKLSESTVRLKQLEDALQEARLFVESFEKASKRTADLEVMLQKAEVSLAEAEQAASSKANDDSLVEFAISAATTRANEFETQVKKLSEDLSIANTRITASTEELVAAKGKVKELESLLAASQTSVSRSQKDLENAAAMHSSQLASQADSYNQRIDSIQKEALKASSTYTAEMSVMRSRLVELQNKAVEVQGKATEFQSKTVDLQAALDDAEERCKELQSRVAEAQGALESIEKAAADASGERDKVELAARMALQAEYELRLSDAKSKIIVLDAQLAVANAQSTSNEVATTESELAMLREAVREAQARESLERERALNAVSAAEAAAAQMNREAEESKKLREKNVIDSQRFAQLEGNRRARAGTASSYSPAPQPQLGVQSAQVAAVKLIQGQFGPGGIFGVERSIAPPTASTQPSLSSSSGPAKQASAPNNPASSLASVMRSASSFMSSVPSITSNSSKPVSQPLMQQQQRPIAMTTPQSKPMPVTAPPKVIAKTFDPANPFG